MSHIIGSRVDLDTHNSLYAIEFSDCVAGLMENDDIQKLDMYSQHLNTSRLQHSLNVSYYSYLFCKRLNLDFRSAARAGLMHDLFLYDWRKKNHKKRQHIIEHPKAALENARKNTDLNSIEEDAIAKHMWPLCGSMPVYKESFIVSLADKYCAAGEVISAVFQSIKRKIHV